MATNSVFLEVDTSIRDKNLLITKSTEEEEDFNKFLTTSGIGQTRSIAVKPTAGFCVKARETNTGNKKIFINFCQTDKIPSPRPITETQLAELLDSEDEICDYRIPMSIGSVRIEKDNKGEEVNVCDIAINTVFMGKVKEKPTFKEFLIAVAFEGYQTKFDVTVSSERIVLKNKKVMGTLQVHHIQQRDVERKMGLPETLPKLDEIGKAEMSVVEEKTKMIQVLDDVMNEPKYRLFMKRTDAHTLYGEFYLPYVTSAKDISLDIGEDRLILETTNGKYFLDMFHEYCVDQQKAFSEYNIATKFLTVTMPIATK